MFSCATIIGQYLHPSFNIMNGRKAVLKRVGFGEMVVDFSRIVGAVKISIGSWTNVPALWVDQRTVSGGALVVGHVGVPILEALCRPCDTCIVVGIFQRLAHRFTFVLNTEKPILLVFLQPKDIHLCRGTHGFDG